MQESFLGYGSIETAKYWFVGAEEGGDISQNSIRTELLMELGAPEFANVKQFHQRLSEKIKADFPKESKRYGRYFEDTDPKLQKTWKDLSKIALVYEGTPVSKAALKEFQRNNLDIDCLLLEVRHGSAHSIEEKRVSKLLIYKRLSRIVELLSLNQPKFVVFYGNASIKAAEGYLGTLRKLDINLPRANFYSVTDGPIVVTTLHPNARGVTGEYWESIGFKLKTLVSGQPMR